MKKGITISLVLFCVLLLASCAPGPNPNRNTVDRDGEVAGYFQGLWHAIIMPFAFIGSWFSHDVNIYEVHNNGFWYHLGLFTPGLIIAFLNTVIVMSQLQ